MNRTAAVLISLLAWLAFCAGLAIGSRSWGLAGGPTAVPYFVASAVEAVWLIALAAYIFGDRRS